MERKEVDFDNIFMFIMEAMVKSSPEKLRLVYKEKDKSFSVDQEAGHFLKLKGERIG